MYLSDKALATRYDVTRQTIWRWVRNHSFPEPVKLASGTTRWTEQSVIEFEQKQKSEGVK